MNVFLLPSNKTSLWDGSKRFTAPFFVMCAKGVCSPPPSPRFPVKKSLFISRMRLPDFRPHRYSTYTFLLHVSGKWMFVSPAVKLGSQVGFRRCARIFLGTPSLDHATMRYLRNWSAFAWVSASGGRERLGKKYLSPPIIRHYLQVEFQKVKI